YAPGAGTRRATRQAFAPRGVSGTGREARIHQRREVSPCEGLVRLPWAPSRRRPSAWPSSLRRRRPTITTTTSGTVIASGTGTASTATSTTGSTTGSTTATGTGAGTVTGTGTAAP